jgi:transcriptional regulator with XRE-family HTH domain
MSNKYGEVFRRERRRAGKTLGDVARCLDLSIPYICDIEHGRRQPLDAARNAKLAAFFDSDLDHLLQAAAESLDHILLEAPRTHAGREAAAALMRSWKDLEEDELREIRDLLARKRGAQ